MTLDQALSTIHASPVASDSLVTHTTSLSSWFMFYSILTTVNMAPTKKNSVDEKSLSSNSYGNSMKNKNADSIVLRTLSYKQISKYAFNHSIVPYLMKEAHLCRYHSFSFNIL
jgi:hypothetical protein